MRRQRDTEFPVEPMPEWFVDAVCRIRSPNNQTLSVVARSARQYAYVFDRMLEAHAQVPLSDSAVALELDQARAMARLLWAALSALKAANVVLTEPPCALA